MSSDGSLHGDNHKRLIGTEIEVRVAGWLLLAPHSLMHLAGAYLRSQGPWRCANRLPDRPSRPLRPHGIDSEATAGDPRLGNRDARFSRPAILERDLAQLEEARCRVPNKVSISRAALGHGLFVLTTEGSQVPLQTGRQVAVGGSGDVPYQQSGRKRGRRRSGIDAGRASPGPRPVSAFKVHSSVEGASLAEPLLVDSLTIRSQAVIVSILAQDNEAQHVFSVSFVLPSSETACAHPSCAEHASEKLSTTSRPAS